MTYLLLVRHALTDWVHHRLAGWTPGIPLNAVGREQAAALGQRLAPWPIQAIYTSPIDRAKETADALAGPHHLTPVVLDDLTEVDAGEWTGQDIDVVRQTDLWRAIQTSPKTVRLPGGESLVEVQARMVRAVTQIGQAHGDGLVVAVSHADPIRVVLAHYLGLDLDFFQRLVIDPASVSVLALGKDGEATRLLRLNDTGEWTVPSP